MKFCKNLFLITFFIILFFGFVWADQEQWEEYKMLEKLRYKMVEKQIRQRGITDTLVLNAMKTVPRHLFVPEKLKKYAYDDSPLPIGLGQTISQPYIVAFMTDNLGLTGNEKVLEIGTGSGYQAAILAEIADTVYTIEIVSELYKEAMELLNNKLGYTNIITKCDDGYQGWKEHAPFDAVIVTAAPNHIPQPLIDQLKIGGKMIIPVGEFSQNLILITKDKKGIQKKKVLPVRFVPMTGEAEEK